MRQIEKHPMIMIVIGVIGISLSSIFVRYSDAPSSVTAALRLLWTVILMTPVVLGKRQVRAQLLQVPLKSILLSALSGLFLAIHFVLWFESLYHTSVASSTTIVCTEVIWVSIGFCMFMKGKLTGREILTIGVTLIGSVLIAYADSSGGRGHLRGDLLALLAAVAVAVYMLLGRLVRETVSTSVYTYIVYVVCCITLIGICIAQKNHLFVYGARTIIIGFLLALFSTILGHSIFSWCLKYFSPSFVSASKLCEPVVAAIFAAVLFNEIPSPVQLLGAALILGGVYYYSGLQKE